MRKYLLKALSLWYLLWQLGQTNTETMFLFIHSIDIYGASITYQALICEIGYESAEKKKERQRASALTKPSRGEGPSKGHMSSVLRMRESSECSEGA